MAIFKKDVFRLLRSSVILLFVSSICISLSGQQPTFNKRFAIKRSSWFSNVNEVNGRYLLSGLAVDTANGYYFDQLATMHLNNNGDTSNVKYFGNTELPFFPGWDGYSELTGRYLQSGYETRNGVPVSFLVWYNAVGDTLFSREYTSPYTVLFGEEWDHMRPTFSRINQDSTTIFTNQVFKEDTGSDVLIYKLNANGGILWDYNYVSQTRDFCNAIISFKGGFLAAIIEINENAWWYSNGHFNETHLIHLGNNGDEIDDWDLEQMWGIHVSAIVDMHLDSSSVVFAGESAELEDWKPLALIGKCDSIGNLLWYKRLGITTMNHAGSWFNSLEATKDGNYVAGGNFVQYNTLDPFPGADGQTKEIVWFNKLDKNTGDVLWTRYHWYIDDPDAYHNMFSMKATSDGGFIVCGEVRYYDEISDSLNLPSQQAWVMKLDECGCLVPGCDPDCIYTPQIPIFSNPEQNLFIAGPNPANEQLHLFVFEEAGNNNYFNIYDNNGKLIKSFAAPMSNTTYTIDVQHWSPGIYFVHFVNEIGKLQRMKILVQ